MIYALVILFFIVVILFIELMSRRNEIQSMSLLSRDKDIQIKKLKSENKKLKTKIDSLMREIMKLESHKMSGMSMIPEVDISLEEKPSLTIYDIHWDQKERFYMTMPDAHGNFHLSTKQNTYDPTLCFYEFAENDDGSYFFRLIDGSLKLAVKYPHKIIDPVCDILNGSLIHSTKIENIQYGKALLKQDTFTVIDRLQVELK